MKTVLKIIGIVLATFILIIFLSITFSDSDDTTTISPTIEVTDSVRRASDSIRALEKTLKDSLRIEGQKAMAAKREEAEAKLKTFRNKSDEFEGTSFFHHPQTPKYTNRNFIFPYIGKKGDHFWLRLVFQYTADSWLFIHTVKIKTDSEQYEISPKFQRDNNSEIWEWVDISAGQAEYLMLRDMANSKEVIIRYEGRQYYKDRKLTFKEKKVITETLDVYDGL